MHTMIRFCKKSPRPAFALHLRAMALRRTWATAVGPFLEKGALAYGTVRTPMIAVLLSLLISTCTGCAGPRSKAPATSSALHHLSPVASHFEVRGKASLSDGRRHVQLSLRWKQVGDHYVIHLYGPLGSGAVRLSNDPQHPSRVEYQDAKGAVHSYASAEALLEQETGWQLPISGLSWWLRGLPQPLGQISKSQRSTKRSIRAPLIVRNQEGLITHLEQEGWVIDYGAYQSIARSRSPFEGGSGRRLQGYVPHKVQLSRAKLRLKFVLREWQ